ncbi:hypothetical protein ACFLUJ_04885 [Chloroflexota bacterium]
MVDKSIISLIARLVGTVLKPKANNSQSQDYQRERYPYRPTTDVFPLFESSFCYHWMYAIFVSFPERKSESHGRGGWSPLFQQNSVSLDDKQTQFIKIETVEPQIG